MNNPTESTMEIVNRGLAKRYRREKRFQMFGLGAIILSIFFLVFLFGSIFSNGYTAFQQSVVYLDIDFSKEVLDVDNLRQANYSKLIRSSLLELFPDVSGRSDKRALYKLVSSGAAFELQDMVINNPSLIGTIKLVRLPADDEVDMLLKGHISREVPEDERRISDQQILWVDQLLDSGRLDKEFNTTFLLLEIQESLNSLVLKEP